MTVTTYMLPIVDLYTDECKDHVFAESPQRALDIASYQYGAISITCVNWNTPFAFPNVDIDEEGGREDMDETIVCPHCRQNV
jgi:hypothetical protein